MKEDKQPRNRVAGFEEKEQLGGGLLRQLDCVRPYQPMDVLEGCMRYCRNQLGKSYLFPIITTKILSSPL